MSEQIKITIEETEHIVVRRVKRARLFCVFCRTETEMFSPDEFVLSYRIGGAELVALINRGAVHFSETAEGFLLICPASLGNRCPADGTADAPREITM